MKAFSETERQEFLAAKHVAVLSVAADGRPPASVPMWYDYTPGGDIRINTGAGARKSKLIEQAGAVTLVVQNEEPPYQYVVVEGTVVDTDAHAGGGARSHRYPLPRGGRRTRVRPQHRGIRPTVLFTVRPDRWITADFSDEL